MPSFGVPTAFSDISKTSLKFPRVRFSLFPSLSFQRKVLMSSLNISISVYMFIFTVGKKDDLYSKTCRSRSLFAQKKKEKSSIPNESFDVSQPRVGLTTINIHSSGAPNKVVFFVFSCFRLHEALATFI